LSPETTPSERVAAIAATKALCQHSESFQKDLFQYLLVLQKNQLILRDPIFEVLELFVHCKACFKNKPSNIGKVYWILEEMYTKSSTTDEQAMACLDALTQFVITIVSLKAGNTIEEAIIALQEIQSPEMEGKFFFNFLQLVEKYVSFLRHQVLEKDPRYIIQTFTLVLLKQFIDSCSNVLELSVLLQEQSYSDNDKNMNLYVFLWQFVHQVIFLNAEFQNIPQYQRLESFHLYHSLCKFQVPSDSDKVLKYLKTLVDGCQEKTYKKQEQFGLLYVQIHYTCFQTRMRSMASDHNQKERNNCIDSLLGTLLEILKDPIAFDLLPEVWSESLNIVKNLVLTLYDTDTGSSDGLNGLVSYLFEIVLQQPPPPPPPQKQLQMTMEEKLVVLISHLAPLYREEIQFFKSKVLEYLSNATICDDSSSSSSSSDGSSDGTITTTTTTITSSSSSNSISVTKKTLMAFLIIFLQAFCGEEEVELMSFLSIFMKHLTHEEKFHLGKEAILNGHFEIALQLLETLPDHFDDEYLVYWIQSLIQMIQTERKIILNGTVSLDVVAKMTKSLITLRAASSSHFTYIFQQKMIQLRIEMLLLLQKTQQFAGEIAFIYGENTLSVNTTSTISLSKHQELKAKQLSVSFEKLAGEIDCLKSALYGCDPLDLSLFQAYHRVCLCLSYGIKGFLGLDSDSGSLLNKSFNGRTQPPSSKNVPLIEASFLLQIEIASKIQALDKIAPNMNVIGLGAQLLLVLVESIHRVPFIMPRIFFCMENSKKKLPKLSMEAQFLTFTEKNSFVTKPRVRSQVGLALGTSLSCFLQGVLVVELEKDQKQQIDKQIENLLEDLNAIEVELHIQQEEMTNTGATSKEGTIRYVPHKISIPIDPITTQWWQNGQTQVLIPFDSSVLISSEFLTSKGSFILRGTVTVVDTTHNNQWIIGSRRTTGTGKPIFPLQRGFIVY
jgi:hypothetical protein